MASAFELGTNIDQEEHWDRAERFLNSAASRIRNDGAMNVDYYINDYPRQFTNVWGRPTNRPIEVIAGLHGYELEDFLLTIEDKVVVDIGGGHSYLNSAAADRGIKTTIINLDLPSAFCTEPFDLKTVRKVPGENELIANADSMPLADESVDLMFATYSLPFHAHSADQIEGLLNEVIRVLKLGGSASFNTFLPGSCRGDRHRSLGMLRAYGMLRAMSNLDTVKIEFGAGREEDGRYSTDFVKITKLDSITQAL